MAIAKRSKDDAGSSVATSGETKRGRVGKENLLWKGLLRKEELEKLATEFSGDGDFTICPGYTGSYGSASDKWGRLYIPGADASYRVARRRLSTWREKTRSDERFAWWPEAMQRRGAEPVKASDIIKGLHIATWKRYLTVYRKASKVRVGIKTRERRIREAVLEQADDPTPAAGVLLALADGTSSSVEDKPGESS